MAFAHVKHCLYRNTRRYSKPIVAASSGVRGRHHAQPTQKLHNKRSSPSPALDIPKAATDVKGFTSGISEQRTPALPSVHRVSTRSRGFLERILKNPQDAAILALAGPAFVGFAADPLLTIIDTAFVGRLGAENLAALGVNTSIFSMAFVTFNFLAVVSTPLIASAVSANNKEQAGQVTLQALALSLVLGTAVSLGLTFGSESVLQLMGVNEQSSLHDLAKGYLTIRALAGPSVLISTVGQGVLRGLKDTRSPLMVALTANLLHLGLDPLLMWGPPQMGLQGAALSTLISELLAGSLYLGLLWQRREQLGIWPLPPSLLPSSSATQKAQPSQFIKGGGAMLLRTGLLTSTRTVAAATATRLGAVALASHQVLLQVWLLASLLIDSLAVAGQALVAAARGRGDHEEARAVAERLMQMGIGLGAVLMVLLGGSSSVWPHLFTDDQQVVDTVQHLVPVAVGILPINAVVYTLDGIMVGCADFSFLVAAMALAVTPAAAVLMATEPHGWGMEGVWAGMALLMAGRAGTLVWRYNSEDGPLRTAEREVAEREAAGGQGRLRSGEGDTPVVVGASRVEGARRGAVVVVASNIVPVEASVVGARRRGQAAADRTSRVEGSGRGSSSNSN